jgi:DnaJ like chaperone protein
MLNLVPDILAILVIVVIGAVIIGIPYSIFVSLPRAFRRGLEERLNSTTAVGTASATQNNGRGSGANDTGDPSQSTPETKSPVSSRADALEILGLSPRASDAEIRAAYRRLVSEWHPDRLNNMAKELRDIATERVKSINQAYEVLIR